MQTEKKYGINIKKNLLQEQNKLIHIRNFISKMDMESLYYNIATNNNNNNNNINNNNSLSIMNLVNIIIPKTVKIFISNIPYFEYILNVSDELYKITIPFSDKYPNFIHGLIFLIKLKHNLNLNRYNILQSKINDHIYYSGLIANEDINKTREMWLSIFDDMLWDLKSTE